VPHRHSRADTKDAGSGPEVQLGFGCVLYGGLCHTGIKSYEGLVFPGRKSDVIGRVLYGGSECLKENDTTAKKLCKTSERSEKVKRGGNESELEVDKFWFEGKEVKLRGASR
jgi:hypothetical protein